MGFWKDLAEGMAEGLSNAAQAQNPAVRAKMKDHTIALLRMNRNSGSGNLASIIVESVGSSAMRASYLNDLPFKEVKILDSYLDGEVRSARERANENRHDREEEALASGLESLSRVLRDYISNRAQSE